MYDTWQEHVAAAAISSLTIAWTILVNREVPAPYLVREVQFVPDL